MLAGRYLDHGAGFGIEKSLLQRLLERQVVRGQAPLRARALAASGGERAQNDDTGFTYDPSPETLATPLICP
jgi:hypothetical protein